VPSLLTNRLSFDEYDALPGEHFSGLKALDTSPLHYNAAIRKNDTQAMRLGRTLHALALDPGSVDYVVWSGDKRGKAWETFKGDHAGSTILTQDELDRALGMRRALNAHPVASPLLAAGHGEVTAAWDLDGVACRARLDWVLPDGGLLELKTTRRIHPVAFSREVVSRLYHAQIAFYSSGLEAARGERSPRHVLIAAENEPPHDIAVYNVPAEVLDAGWRKVAGWLRTLQDCRASGRWPGVGGSELLDLKLPDWALAEGLPEVDLGGIGEHGDG
jgi:hypothetical protein